MIKSAQSIISTFAGIRLATRRRWNSLSAREQQFLVIAVLITSAFILVSVQEWVSSKYTHNLKVWNEKKLEVKLMQENAAEFKHLSAMPEIEKREINDLLSIVSALFKSYGMNDIAVESIESQISLKGHGRVVNLLKVLATFQKDYGLNISKVDIQTKNDQAAFDIQLDVGDRDAY